MEQKYKYMVATRCFTFNHAQYIVDAMNGFTLQETPFPVITCIVDDASTDGEQEVIRKYLKDYFQTPYCVEENENYLLTCAKHLTNPNCTFIVYFLKYNHYSVKKPKFPYLSEWLDKAKYQAICEGDDYWIHPAFVRKCVEYLNEHSDYSAVFGNKIVTDKFGNILAKNKFKSGITLKDIMRGKNMGIRNLIFRREIRDVSPFANIGKDLYVYYQCAASGKLKYIDEDFAVYRLTGNGAYSKLDERGIIKTSYEQYYQFHAALDFKYQKQYVEYQMRKLVANIGKKDYFHYCLILIKKYHVPSGRRFLWYPMYFLLGLIKGIKTKLLK